MDDLISRQAAIAAIGEKPFAGTADECEYEQGLQNQWERDVVAIKILPPARSERKKGKWIDRGDNCVCNQCGHTEQQFNGVEPIPMHTPFCAMCGADMRAFEKNVDTMTVQPERKTGKWIEYIPEHGKCPFCGNQIDLLNGKANNFCGECGADMRGETNENNRRGRIERKND